MVAEISVRHALARDVVEGVNERTGGVPLFVEEVTRLLLERGVEGGAQAIPPTLQQSLAARLDRLGAAREIAQIGAVLGRGFSHALLYEVAAMEEGALQSALDRLAAADILFIEGDRPAGELPLQARADPGRRVREPAQGRRQALHRRAAEVLATSPNTRRPSRRRSPIISPRPASTISRSNGGAWRAIRRCAARPSRRRSPISARRSQWRTGRARRRGGRRAARPRRTTDRSRLHVAYGNALFAARGWGAPETTKPSLSPRVGVWRQGRARTIGGRLRAVVQEATCGASCHRCGRPGGLPQRRRGQARFAGGRRRPIAPPGVTCWFAGE